MTLSRNKGDTWLIECTYDGGSLDGVEISAQINRGAVTMVFDLVAQADEGGKFYLYASAAKTAEIPVNVYAFFIRFTDSDGNKDSTDREAFAVSSLFDLGPIPSSARAPVTLAIGNYGSVQVQAVSPVGHELDVPGDSSTFAAAITGSSFVSGVASINQAVDALPLAATLVGTSALSGSAYSSLSFAAAMIGGSSVMGAASVGSQIQSVSYIAADGAWSPHYNGATAPAAVMNDALGTVDYVYEAGEIGMTPEFERKPMLAEVDTVTGEVSTFSVSTNAVSLKGDDHGVPSIAVDPTTGQRFVFHSSHQHPQPWSYERVPGSGAFSDGTNIPTITARNAADTADVNVRWSYPKPVFLDGNLYLFHAATYEDHYGNPISKRVLSLMTPTALDGDSVPTGWARREIIDVGDMNGISGLNAGSRVYHGQFVVRGGLLYIPTGITDSGDSVRKHPGVVVFDPATGNISNLAGTFTATPAQQPIDWATYRDNFLIMLTADADESDPPTLAFDSSGELHAVYRRGGSGSGSLTFYHRIFTGGAWSAETSTGVVMGNAFDSATIRFMDDGTTLEMLYVNDVTSSYNREGEVWRKTWTASGGWSAGAQILGAEAPRPGRGRPWPVVDGTDAHSFVMAEKSNGTSGEPGNPYYGEHLCWMWGSDGGFVDRELTTLASPTPDLAPMLVGGGAGTVYAQALPTGDTTAPFPIIELVNDDSGQFVLADDTRQQQSFIASTGTLAAGSYSVTVKSAGPLGNESAEVVIPITVLPGVPITTYAANALEWDSRHIARYDARANGTIAVAPLPGQAFTRWYNTTGAQYMQVLDANRPLTAAEPIQMEDGGTVNVMKQSNSTGTWAVFCRVKLNSIANDRTIILFGFGKPTDNSRLGIYWDASEGHWALSTPSGSEAQIDHNGTDEVVLMLGFDGTNYILGVDGVEATVAGASTSSGCTILPDGGVEIRAMSWLPTLPDATGRAALATRYS